MRIALFSDAHGNLTALRAVLAAIDAHRPVQMVVAAGDHCLAGARPAETWDALQGAGCVCIYGNEDDVLFHDREGFPGSRWNAHNRALRETTRTALGPERLAAMRAMPRSLRLSPAPGQDVLVVHANIHGPYGYAFNATMPEATITRLYGGANARVICCGHYHEAAVRTWEDAGERVALVNVASVSLPVDKQPLAGFTLLDWNGAAWAARQFRVPYDAAERAAEAENGFGGAGFSP